MESSTNYERRPRPVSAPVPVRSPWKTDDERVQSFARALEALRTEIEVELGEPDAEHIRRIGSLSNRLELVGRGLLYVSFEPLGFSLGTLSLALHKALELMEIGHLALHGAYEGLEGAERYAADSFKWKSPVDEASWRMAHNVRHHQHTNIVGLDPDLDFGLLRLSARVPHKALHFLQPITNVASWFGFGTALNLHATGMLDVLSNRPDPLQLPDQTPESRRGARRAFFSKQLRYFGKEYVFYPLLAGPFFPKVLLGNVLSEVMRDVWAAAIIYCGHVGANDHPRGTAPKTRGDWYVLQAEAARDVELPEFMSILAGALDKQIEHHLFPRLPPNRLREIAPRVRAICEEHGVQYRSASWSETLESVLSELRRISSAGAEAETPEPAPIQRHLTPV